jgi:truncated hemoglobin YjbI
MPDTHSLLISIPCAQVNHREEWLQCLRTTFDAMDADRDGRLRPSEILEALKDKLPEAEVSNKHELQPRTQDPQP